MSLRTSGYITLPVPSTDGSVPPGAYITIATFVLKPGELPTPIEAHVTVEAPNSQYPNAQWTAQYDLPAGIITFQDDTVTPDPALSLYPYGGAGIMRWTVSRDGVQNVFFTDLRNGRFHLGYCDFVKVDALRWDLNCAGADSAVGLTVGVSLADTTHGGGADYDDFVYTAVGLSAADADALDQSIFIPPRARYFTPLYAPDPGTPAAFWGSSLPDLAFNGNDSAGNFGECVLIQPSTNTIVPVKARYEVGGGARFGFAASGVGDGSGYVYGARFYLSR